MIFSYNISKNRKEYCKNVLILCKTEKFEFTLDIYNIKCYNTSVDLWDSYAIFNRFCYLPVLSRVCK